MMMNEVKENYTLDLYSEIAELAAINADLLEALQLAERHIRSEMHSAHVPMQGKDLATIQEALRKAKSHADTLKGDCPDCEGTGKQTTENGTYQYDCLSCNGKGQ